MENMEKWFERARKTMMIYAVVMGALVVALIAMLLFHVKFIVIIGVLVGFVVGAICLTISNYFEEENSKEIMIRAGVAFLLYIIVYATIGKAPAWLAMIMLLIPLAMMGYLIYWWYQEGSTVKELIAFMLLDVLILWGLAMPAAASILDITQGWVAAIVMSLPKIVFIVSVGFFIANMIWFKEEMNSLEGGE